MRVLWRWQSPWCPTRFPEAIFWGWLQHDLIPRVYPESDPESPKYREIMEKALIAYYVMVDPRTNKRAKTVLAWALLYFVSPVDLAPDLIEVLGKLDDPGILTAALAMVSIYVGPEHVKKAEEKMELYPDPALPILKP